MVITAALRHLPVDNQRTARRIDLPGVVMLSVTLLLVVLPLVLGRTAGWPLWTWVSLVASVPVFVLFLVFERHISANDGSPLVNVQVLVLPAVYWSLLTLMAATGTYYALLFTLAQYLQQGLRDSPFVSGLTLVPWVAAFGLAGQLVRRLPTRLAPRAPVAGCLLLAASYVAISLVLFSGHHDEALLVVLLASGGLGLGIQFSALIAHLARAVPTEYAPDISGVSTTTMQIGGSLGVAAFGTFYLSLSSSAGAAHTTHAFAVTTTAFAAVILLASIASYRATRRPEVQRDLGRQRARSSSSTNR
jgi:MFS family permease